MATTINKTDGSVLTTIADGAVDLSSTNIALIGRLYRNYGELINENMVKMLENFANASSPSTPIIGQIWYDKSNKKLNVYRDTGFVGIGVVTNSNAEPNIPQFGDLWYDTADAQLKLWTGSIWEVMAPQYTSSQGKSGIFVENITDILNNNHIAVLIYQQNNIISIFSRDNTYTPKNSISGFTTINTGLNISSIGKLHGIATDSEKLGGVLAANYLRSDANDTATGTISIANDTSLVLGADGDLTLGVSGSNFVFTKNNTGSFRFVVDGTENAVEINNNQQLTLADGSVTFPSLSFTGDTNTGIYRLAENTFSLVTNGSSKLTIGTSGVTSNVDFNAGGNTISSATGTFSTVNVISQLNTPLINGSTVVNGDLSIINNTSIGGTAAIGGSVSIGGTLTTVGETLFNNNSTITGVLSLTGASLNIPNDLSISNGNVSLFGNLAVAGDSAVAGSQIIVNDLNVGDDTFLDSELLVQYNSETERSAFRVDASGRIIINTVGPAVAASNPGDITLGSTNSIYAYNTAKYWAAWTDNIYPLGIVASHDVDSVTTLPLAGEYRLNLSYFLTAGAYYSVVGMSSYGNMVLKELPIGGNYVDIRIEDYYYWPFSFYYGAGTPYSSYNSIALFGE